METMKDLRVADQEYIDARNRMIGAAERCAKVLAKEGFMHPARAFAHEMTRLTEQAGLIGPGNLALFNNTKLSPFSVAAATTGGCKMVPR
jgi:hypothetical protein